MAQLIVRNLPDEVIAALTRRAARHDRSAEEEHRETLQRALLGPRKRSFSEVLARIPNVGLDADFEREQADRRA